MWKLFISSDQLFRMNIYERLSSNEIADHCRSILSVNMYNLYETYKKMVIIRDKVINFNV